MHSVLVEHTHTQCPCKDSYNRLAEKERLCVKSMNWKLNHSTGRMQEDAVLTDCDFAFFPFKERKRKAKERMEQTHQTEGKE